MGSIPASNPSCKKRMFLAPVFAALLFLGPFLASPVPDEEPGALVEEDRFSGALVGSILLQILVNIIRAQIQEILGISTTTTGDTTTTTTTTTPSTTTITTTTVPT